MKSTVVSALNNVISTAGLARCISAQEAEKYALLYQSLTDDTGKDRASVWIGYGETLLAGVGLALAMSNPIGWAGLAAAGVAAVGSSGAISNVYARFKNGRKQNAFRELTTWEDEHYQPWLESVISAAREMMHDGPSDVYKALVLGVDVDPTMADKVLGDWCVSVAADESAFNLVGLAAMLTVRHLDRKMDGDSSQMESLFEAIGEADLILTNAGSDASPSFEFFQEWYIPKVLNSKSPFLGPMTHNLARVVATYYGECQAPELLSDRLAILTLGYYLKLKQVLCNKLSRK